MTILYSRSRFKVGMPLEPSKRSTAVTPGSASNALRIISGSWPLSAYVIRIFVLRHEGGGGGGGGGGGAATSSFVTKASASPLKVVSKAPAVVGKSDADV